MEYETLAGFDESRLWELLGDGVLDGPGADAFETQVVGLGSRQTRAERSRAVADAWFSRNREALRAAICDNAAVRKAFSSDPGAVVELARAVGDAFAALHLLVPVPTMAMLVARKGLDWICGDGPGSAAG